MGSQTKLTEKQWWDHLDALSQKDSMEEFWYTYAAYLRDRNIYSRARQILYDSAVKTVRELRGEQSDQSS